MGEDMSNVIRIGTRKSMLAIAQTKQVVRELKDMDPALEIELVPMSTMGDRTLDKSLESFGGKGAFISEFEDAILNGEIDLAVHSAKDMPMILPDTLSILGVSRREDVRDVIVYKREGVHKLNSESIVGTSSLRRRLQIENAFQVQIKNLRGNINTRLSKLLSNEYDAIVLACAGLKRLDLLNNEEFFFEYLDPEIFTPAAGQGIIAVEGRSQDKRLATLLKEWSHDISSYCLETEREVIRLLNSGCNEPVGVYTTIANNEISLRIYYKYNNKILKLSDKSNIEDRFTLAKNLVGRIYQ